MPATNAAIAFGYTLAGTLLGTVAEITELKPGKKAVQKIEIHRNDSPDLYGEKISGWIDEGDWECKSVYAPGQRTVLEAAIGVVDTFTFTRPDGTTTSAFSGFLSELGDEVPLKEFMSTDFKLTVSGKVTFAS